MGEFWSGVIKIVSEGTILHFISFLFMVTFRANQILQFSLSFLPWTRCIYAATLCVVIKQRCFPFFMYPIQKRMQILIVILILTQYICFNPQEFALQLILTRSWHTWTTPVSCGSSTSPRSTFTSVPDSTTRSEVRVVPWLSAPPPSDTGGSSNSSPDTKSPRRFVNFMQCSFKSKFRFICWFNPVVQNHLIYVRKFFRWTTFVSV